MGNKASQVVTGLLLIGLGLLFFADRQGWAWGWHGSVLRLWPFVLIILGVPKFIVAVTDVEPAAESAAAGQAVPRRRYQLGSGFWLVLVGVLMALHINHKVRLDQSWPLFIVGGGLSMLFGSRRHPRRRRGN